MKWGKPLESDRSVVGETEKVRKKPKRKTRIFSNFKCFMEVRRNKYKEKCNTI